MKDLVNRRDFLRLGALFVPAMAVSRVAYSFLWAPKPITFTGMDFGAIGGVTVFSVFDRKGRLIYLGTPTQCVGEIAKSHPQGWPYTVSDTL